MLGPDSFPVIDDESGGLLGADTSAFHSFESNINDCQNHIADYHKSCQQARGRTRDDSQLLRDDLPSSEGSTTANKN